MLIGTQHCPSLHYRYEALVSGQCCCTPKRGPHLRRFSGSISDTPQPRIPARPVLRAPSRPVDPTCTERPTLTIPLLPPWCIVVSVCACSGLRRRHLGLLDSYLLSPNELPAADAFCHLLGPHQTTQQLHYRVTLLCCGLVTGLGKSISDRRT